MSRSLLRGGLAAACLLAAGAAAPASSARAESPYAIHSMVYPNAPASFKDAMFREAAALGAGAIRVDVSVGAIGAGSDWSSLDEYLALARRYRLRVVGVLLGTPWWLARCPAGTPPEESYKCPASDAAAYAALAAQIAARARGVIDDWEIRNEPDGRWAYLGTPRDYARELVATARAIRAANPRARVLLGGVMSLDSRGWLREVFETHGARESFDIANVHVRGPLASLGRIVARWRAFFGAGIPLWITEHGYPSDPRYQHGSPAADGEREQARYLARSLPALIAAGAARVFVTERDNLGGAFASEGLLGGGVADPPLPDPVVRRKPAAAVFAALASRGR